MFYIAVRDAEETSLSVISLSQLKKALSIRALILFFLNFI